MNRGFPLLLLGVILLLLLLSLVACAPSPTTPTPTPTPSPTPTPILETLTYTNSEWGFSVEYPKDWSIHEGSGVATVVFVGPLIKETGGQISIIIGAQDLTEFPNLTLEECVDFAKLGIEEGAQNYEEVGEYDAVVDGLPAIVWSWREELEGTKLLGTMANFMKDDVLYLINYGATPSCYDNYLDCFELMLSTFKFE